MTKEIKRLGKVLTAIRGDATQEEFAAHLGISRGYLSDLERGAREVSLTTFMTIVKKTRATPNTLLGF